jgi:hypothetical protein
LIVLDVLQSLRLVGIHERARVWTVLQVSTA